MKYALVGASCLVLLLAFIVGSNYYQDIQVEKYGFMAEKNAETFVREHSQTKGSEDAKVTIIAFMDPACETCAAFAPFYRADHGRQSRQDQTGLALRTFS